jgi:alcohol dehydrogenase class IV
VLRSTATTVFAGLVGALSQVNEANPLVEADHRQAFRLAHDAYLVLAEQPDSAAPRRALALAAFLQNRAEDDGGRVVRRGAYSGNYAVSTALHLRHPHVGQGESISAIHTTRMRLEEAPDAQGTRDLADALGVWSSRMTTRSARNAVADHIDSIYTRLGMPTRLRDLEIPRDGLAHIAAATIKNFNANAGLRSPQEQNDEALHLLEAAW